MNTRTNHQPVAEQQVADRPLAEQLEPARPGLTGPDFTRADVARPDTPRAVGSLPYHRLMRQAPKSARWWKPLTAATVAIGLYLACFLLFFLPTLIADELLLGPEWSSSSELTDPSKPMDMFISLGIIAIMVPAAVLGMRWGGGAKGIIHSVASRVRWGLMSRAAAIVLPVFAVLVIGSTLLDPSKTLAWPGANLQTFVLYAIILLLAPLQCAGEEYVFRGLPMQIFGAWLRSPLWGILVPVPLFMLGHGYDWVGQIDIAVFAICMGFLTWKSGGLELAMVVHSANNLFAFLLAPLTGETLEQGAVDPVLLLVSLPTTLGITAVLWVWFSKRYGLRLGEPMRSRAELAREAETQAP